jgi:hypothetical protein
MAPLLDRKLEHPITAAMFREIISDIISSRHHDMLEIVPIQPEY